MRSNLTHSAFSPASPPASRTSFRNSAR
jgi:hypothetical protein